MILAAIGAAGCGGDASSDASTSNMVALAPGDAASDLSAWIGTYSSRAGHAACASDDGKAVFDVRAGDDGALHFFGGDGTDVAPFELVSDVSALAAKDPSTGAVLDSHVRIALGGNPTGQDCHYRFRLVKGETAVAESVGDGCEWDGQDGAGHSVHYVQAITRETLELVDDGIHATIAAGSATIDIWSADRAQHLASCAYEQDVQTTRR